MDRVKFFAAVRSPLFAGKMSGTQVSGLEAIIKDGQRRGQSVQHLAAVLAESHHETGGTMQPLGENLNYSAKRLTQVWPARFPTLAAAQMYANNPRKLANKVYGGRLVTPTRMTGGCIAGAAWRKSPARRNRGRFGGRLFGGPLTEVCISQGWPS